MWGGTDDVLPDFLKGGFWYLGWEPEAHPEQTKRRDSIKEGDGIAVKRMLGQGSKEIEIRALGVVKYVDKDDLHRRVYVNWVASGLKREVPARGAFASIHGPFDPEDEWTREVFLL